jgi:hypothetical protein
LPTSRFPYAICAAGRNPPQIRSVPVATAGDQRSDREDQRTGAQHGEQRPVADEIAGEVKPFAMGALGTPSAWRALP